MTQDALTLLAIPIALAAGGVFWIGDKISQRIAKEHRRRIGHTWYYVRDRSSSSGQYWTRELPEYSIEILAIEEYSTGLTSTLPVRSVESPAVPSFQR